MSFGRRVRPESVFRFVLYVELFDSAVSSMESLTKFRVSTELSWWAGQAKRCVEGLRLALL